MRERTVRFWAYRQTQNSEVDFLEYDDATLVRSVTFDNPTTASRKRLQNLLGVSIAWARPSNVTINARFSNPDLVMIEAEVEGELLLPEAGSVGYLRYAK